MNILTNEIGANFGEQIIELLEDAVSVRVASGYIGYPAFKLIEPRLKQIVRNGGEVSITIGLGYFEGLTEKMLTALRDFDEYARTINEECGIKACAYQHFHGKLYVIQDSKGKVTASIGSSNLSKTGFGDWLEGNLLTEDPIQVSLISDYLDRLEQANAIEIVALEFPERGKKQKAKKQKLKKVTPLKTYSGQLPDISRMRPAFTIPLRVTRASNLNLFMSAGRKSRKPHPRDLHLPKSRQRQVEVLKPRPWYEVEMTVLRQDITSNLLAFLPNQTAPWKFDLVTEDLYVYQALFKVKKSDRAKKTLHQGTLDFMTARREDLGRIIKGELEELGLLRFGEVITEDLLREADITELSFYELSKDVFLMKL